MASCPHCGKDIPEKRGNTPYGEEYNEEKTLKLILELNGTGMSFLGIARRLNDKMIAPRTGKHWSAATVSAIIHRVQRSQRPAS